MNLRELIEIGNRMDTPFDQSARAGNRAKVDQWLSERVFVSCAIDDDLSYVIGQAGDDFVVTATDFPHGDHFSARTSSPMA